MDEIKDLIEKTINPPGILKQNLRALFLAIRDIALLVKKDALTAFNAHFPYLADSKKLQEHGDALLIPRLLHDTETEYRERVAAASFFLMKAGERGYILEQLTAHFGDRYVIRDEFLNVYVKITDPEDEDRAWVMSFLDGILDPNVVMTVAEWFHIIDNVVMEDIQQLGVMRHDDDIFSSGLCCDGRFYCDQGIEILCDGTRYCDGSWNCDYFEPVRGNICDTILTPSCLDGTFFCDGSVACSGFLEIYSPVYIPGIPLFDNEEDVFETHITLSLMEDKAMIDAACDGGLLCDGRNLDSMIDAPMVIRIIRPFLCNGSKTVYAKTLADPLYCDGSFACDDKSWPCTDLTEEEVL
jgi:hypothetical protein